MATTNDKQVIFSLVNVGKVYPPKRQVLREIYLGFYYGAKIGVLGLNGSGKSSLLRIIAGVDQNYTGEITTVGLDIGVSKGGKLAWAVFMPTNGPPHGALTGDYAGVSGQAAVGVGVGGNILVGGSNRSVTLQPFSVEGDTGINLAIGVSDMVLRPGS